MFMNYDNKFKGKVPWRILFSCKTVVVIEKATEVEMNYVFGDKIHVCQA